MPAPALKALQIPQFGLEANKAPGAPSAIIAATWKMGVKDFNLIPTDLIVRDQILKSMSMKNRGNEVTVERGLQWEIPETPLIFDQFHYFLQWAMGTSTKTGVGPAFTWTSTRVPTTVPSHDLRSIEFQLSDGQGNTSPWKMGGCAITELSVKFALGQPLRFSVKGFARRIQSGAITGALTLPPITTPLVESPFALSKVYIDSTFVNLGVTQVVGQVIGADWTYKTGLMPQQTADARSDQDYFLAVLDPDKCEVLLNVDILALTTGSQWLLEKTASEAAGGGTMRAIRIQNDITSGAVAYNLTLDGLYKHTAGSVFTKDDVNNQMHIGLALEGTTDDLGNWLVAKVTNSITALIS